VDLYLMNCCDSRSEKSCEDTEADEDCTRRYSQNKWPNYYQNRVE
jgi:hypothetical protein